MFKSRTFGPYLYTENDLSELPGQTSYTILHIDGFKPEMVKTEQHNERHESAVTSALVSLREGEGTGAGKDCILAIVPVQVKLCDGGRSVYT